MGDGRSAGDLRLLRASSDIVDFLPLDLLIPVASLHREVAEEWKGGEGGGEVATLLGGG